MNIIRNTEFRSNNGPIQKTELVIDDIKVNEFENALLVMGIKDERTGYSVRPLPKKEMDQELSETDKSIDELKELGKRLDDIEKRFSVLVKKYLKPKIDPEKEAEYVEKKNKPDNGDLLVSFYFDSKRPLIDHFRDFHYICEKGTEVNVYVKRP